MPNVFTVAEIIDMGIEKEVKRRDFYARVASQFAAPEMRALFTQLRDWEAEHIQKFTSIRNEITSSEIPETYLGEFASYVKSLVDDMLYAQVTSDQFSKIVNTELAAINIGIGFEKDAILLFNELLNYTEGSEKDKIHALINEEKKHILFLTELKRKYQA